MSADLFEGKMTVEEVKRASKRLLAEAKSIDAAWQHKEMPADVVREFETKVDRAKEFTDWLSEVPPGATPIPLSAEERKKRDKGEGEMEAKIVSPGSAFAEGTAYAMYKGGGFPRSASERQGVPSFMETKSVPAFTGDVVRSDRDPRIDRMLPFERLRLRDVVGRASTSSNQIEFARITSALPDTAAGTAEGELKPEGDLAIGVASAPVRTIASWIPATVQQLEDVSMLRDIIDRELRGDIARLIEYEIMWGDGTGQEMLGIVETPNVPSFTRTLPGTPTLADRLKGMVTDVMLQNFEPSAIVLHHLDWEEVQLTKTSTGAYLGDIWPVSAPQPMLWGVPVVVTHAAESYRDGLATHQRIAVVGDFQRATLWDRNQATVEIGFQGDDFIRNKRTVLGEQRVAFAVRAPGAFTMYETQAASAS